VLAPLGFVLPPAVGALLMSLSTVIVALNARTADRMVVGSGGRGVRLA
jgi:Cu2+-exporting ATPase